jgi:hypothetical protein
VYMPVRAKLKRILRMSKKDESSGKRGKHLVIGSEVGSQGGEGGEGGGYKVKGRG